LAFFLGLKKAFDSIGHVLLIELCGIRGMALNLIKTFISKRPQEVRQNGLFSEIKTN